MNNQSMINFDTLDFAKELKNIEFTDKQAEGLAKLLAKTFKDSGVITKTDLIEYKSVFKEDFTKLEIKVNNIDAKIEAVSWWIKAIAIALIGAVLKYLFSGNLAI